MEFKGDLLGLLRRHDPGRAAACWRGENLTYAELAGRIARFSNHLSSTVEDGRRELRVAVVLPRGLDQLLAILGLYEAGQTFVPIAQNTPPTRLKRILAEAGVRHVVTDGSLVAGVPKGVKCLDVKKLSRGPRVGGSKGRARRIPSRPAYVMYTSGSTGVPKAVEVSREMLVRYIEGIRVRFRLDSSDAYLLTAAFNFSSSIRQIFLPLVEGARLVLADEDDVMDPLALRDLMIKQKVTVIDTVPSLYGAMADLFENAKPRLTLRKSGIRILVSSGEKLTERTGKKISALFPPDARTLSLYGQTESLGVAIHEMGPVGGLADVSVAYGLIGTALPDVKVSLLAEPGAGGLGELCVSKYPYRTWPSSLKRSRGEDFLKIGGLLFYRTGDLAKAGPGGSLAIVGRKDQQIKVNGQRVDLGEVRELLLAQPGAREAAVIGARAFDDSDQLEIRAFVEASRGSVTKLRRALSQELPSYMLPSSLKLLKTFRRTPSGKIDYAALERPGSASGPRSKSSDKAEALLKGAWAGVLGAEPGKDGDFFRSGGDSLKCVRLASHVNAEGFQLRPSEVYELRIFSRILKRLRSGQRGFERPEWETGGGLQRGPVSREVKAPAEFGLAPMQKALLAYCLANDSDGAYVQQSVFEIGGVASSKVDWEKVSAKLGELHIFKTCFDWKKSPEPKGLVLKGPARGVQVKQLGSKHAKKAELEVLNFSKADLRAGFLLSRPPLVRATFFVGLARKAYLTLTYHHLVLDGWSKRNIVAGILESIQGLESGKRSSWQDFHNFLSWKEPDRPADLDGWGAALKGAAKSKLINKDAKSSGFYSGTDPYLEETALLLGARFKRAEALALEQGIDFVTLCAAAWGRCIGQYSGSERAFFGFTVSGRDTGAPGGEDVIGCIADTHPLLVDLRGELPTLHWLKALQRKLNWSRTHPVVDRSKLWELSELSSITRAFESLLTYGRQASFDGGLEGPWAKAIIEVDRTEVPLELSLEHGQDLRAKLTWRGAFYRPIAPKLLQYFIHSLGAICDRLCDPTLPAFEALSQFQRNDNTQRGPVRPAGAGTFVDAFERNARKQPASVAVEDTEEFTYSQIRAMSDRVRDYLLSRDWETDHPVVGVAAERSAAFIAAVIGIMKMGGIYLPLDPSESAERLSRMTRKCACKVVLLSRRTAATAAQSFGVPTEVVILEEVLASEGKARPGQRAQPSPEDPAYLIFTSGSTGEPKAALLQHKGLLNHIAAKIDDLSIAVSDRVAQSASQLFDISVWQMLAPLAAGARVVVVRDDAMREPLALFSVLEQKRVTIFEGVPSHLRLLADEFSERRLNAKRLRTIRWLLITGETLTEGTSARMRSMFPKAELMNAYGPTECSDDVTHYVLPQGLGRLGGRNTVSLGRPIRNMSISIVGPDARPVPYGTYGEIWVTGVGVGLGYFGDAERTAKSFVSYSGQRAYRTGDMGRFDENGEIEFIGREDNQIKIRGKRVELGEIEGVLEREPAISKAVLVAEPQPGGEPMLVAFIKLKEGARGSFTETVKRAAADLPGHMVPGRYVRLSKVPSSASGKVDMQELKSLLRPRQRTVMRGEMNAAEKAVVRIWSDVLKREDFGLDDNFFEKGGSSFSLVLVRSRIRSELKADLSIQELFENPTPRKTATLVGKWNS